jgi:4-hydroxy-4-methyl-2-oxoglutarate aldolase
VNAGDPVAVDPEVLDTLAAAGVATVYEAAGRSGLVDADLAQIVPGTRVAGPARTVLCGQDDNRTVHEAMTRLRPGEVQREADHRDPELAVTGATRDAVLPDLRHARA